MNWFNETKKGYRYDKRIFIGIFSIVAILFFYVLWQEGFNTSPYFYTECKSMMCKNPIKDKTFTCTNEVRLAYLIPLYKDKNCTRNCNESWCNQEYLSPGKYGREPPFLIRNFNIIAFLLFVFGMVLNHLLHNKGKTFDVELTISKDKRFSLLNLNQKK